ncbi:MAG: hypothetical protein Kow0073_16620 [Immundisolibacter sp.]
MVLAALMSLVAGTAQADAVQEVLAVDAARSAALLAADRAALDATLARELRYVHGNGLTQDRASYLDAAVGGAMTYTAITPLERQVRILSPQVALLTGANRVAVRLDGKALQLDVLYTAVYVRQDGAWKLTAWQSTPAPGQ